ncbi:uncharacterized protein LOC105680261 [Bombus impatiens]|uniref:Uncharacterized protein LOC105680261 n=1 Tax=Bombus impatiens TaxID=132113 RepID=A0A6P6F6U4_BOMIM|nr:uncharacterized protein LOC105680261 [Bombus impatiens]
MTERRSRVKYKVERHETARGVSNTHVLRRKNFNRVDLTRVYRNEYFNLCRMLMWNISLYVTSLKTRMCPWEKTGTNCDFEEDELLSYRRMYCTRSETHAKNIISISIYFKNEKGVTLFLP